MVFGAGYQDKRHAGMDMELLLHCFHIKDGFSITLQRVTAHEEDAMQCALFHPGYQQGMLVRELDRIL